MKPVLEHLPLEAGESFVVKHFDYQYYPTPWHFHPEYELVLVTESTGRRFIGDEISDFGPGDLVFLGPSLPHLYRNDPAYYSNQCNQRAKSIVVHFLESSFGESFLALQEAQKISSLFGNSVRGLEITGETNTIINKKMHALCELSGFSRWLLLVEILHVLSESKDLKFISRTHVQGRNETESDRMNKVFEFIMKNFNRDITVEEVARHVNLAENSFSRYFSKRTRKTFIAFVNEVRLNYACKLLRENQVNISEICFQSGFNNLSNFNRQFKCLYKISPMTYRKQYTI